MNTPAGSRGAISRYSRTTSHPIATNMARIQKEKIAAVQAEEDVDIDILHGLSDEVDAIAKGLFGGICPATDRWLLNRPGFHLRGGSCRGWQPSLGCCSRPYRDDAAGFEMTDQTVGNLGINSFEESLVVTVTHAEERV